MERLLNIFNSFNYHWQSKKWVDGFISIVTDTIIPSYPFLAAKIDYNKTILPNEWFRIVEALKDAGIFKLFIPLDCYDDDYGANCKCTKAPKEL